ncbi:MAG: hemerythrin domain-containing protein [Kofleriaceae bacterium]|nr:hemerythrin domain-containing protein [Kofleriaceae bacterium]
MPTQLLNDDGTASMATAIMSSHFALLRDLGCFERAVTEILAGDLTRVAPVRDEWTQFHAALHGHHTAEDTGLFPGLRAQHQDLAPALDKLDAQHRAIDPLLADGDRLFVELAGQAEAALVLVRALQQHLREHLADEERAVIAHLREAKQFPVPPTDEAFELYAGGFAWSTAGLAASVTEPLFAMLPPGLRDRLPAAQDAFTARCRKVWGYEHAACAVTSVPA